MTDYVQIGTLKSQSYKLNSSQFELSGTTLQLKEGGVFINQPTADVVINDSGGDFNLRIEGDTDANTFFLDAGNNRIGIGTATPSVKFEVKTTVANSGIKATDGTRWAVLTGGTLGSGAFNPSVSANDIGIIFSDGTKETGAFVIAPWSDTASGIKITPTAVGIAMTTPAISDGIGLHIAGKILRLATAKTPANSGATGNIGEICWDASFLYVCTNTNTWERTAIATW